MQTIYSFIADHGRIPTLEAGDKPWEFKGWLLWYVQQIHANHPEVPDRWGYWFRTSAAGRLLEEPIPPIHFGEPDRAVFKSLESLARVPAWDMGGWSDFTTLIDWLAWGLGVGKEPAGRLDDAKNEQLYRLVDVGPMLVKPYDYFGFWICDRRGNGWNTNAFYPTPDNVCRMMVQMQFHDAGADGRDTRSMTICDPCLGTGRMLLHASNYSLRLFGMDIDPLVTKISLIHGALYAPWMAFPLPDEIFPEDRPTSVLEIPSQPITSEPFAAAVPEPVAQGSLF